MGDDGFLRCRICRAKLRVTTSHSSMPLFFFGLFLAFMLLATIDMAWFLFWPLLPLAFGVRGVLTKAEVVPEWTSLNQQTPQTVDGQTRSVDTRRQEITPVIHAYSPHYSPVRRYCIYCGAVVNESDWRFCANCGASLIGANRISHLENDNVAHDESYGGNCMVCGLVIHDSDQVAYCIHCGNAAHRLHLLQWIHVKGRCPMCEQNLNEEDI
jgi:hypothetical protein